MLMAGLSWLTDELWRGHCTADIQLPSYPYVFSSYTNNNKKLFHKDAQHLMCEEENTGHTWYNGFVNIGLLLTKRITTASKEQTVPEYSYSAILKWCIKSWLLHFCIRASPKAPFAIQHGHWGVIFPISKDHKCFSLIQMWIEYFGVPWRAVLIHK